MADLIVQYLHYNLLISLFSLPTAWTSAFFNVRPITVNSRLFFHINPRLSSLASPQLLGALAPVPHVNAGKLSDYSIIT